MTEHHWKKDEPSFTTTAISFSLLKNPGAREALDKLKEFYHKGKLHSLIFIADSNISQDEMLAARKWLKSIGHDWAFGHTTFNTSRLEKPDDFIYRVLKSFDVDSLVFAKTAPKESNWIRAVIKTLRMHQFETWDTTMAWIGRLNSRYYMPADPLTEAVEIINTKKGQARVVNSTTWAD